MARPHTAWCRNTELKAAFDALPAGAKGDVGALEDIIRTRVGIDLDRRKFAVPASCLRYFGNLKAKQYPNELAQFLSFLHTKRTEIRSYLEIGAERCGTFYTVDSYLRSVNPEFQRSTAVDKAKRWCRFRAYQAAYDCRFVRMRSSNYVMDAPADLVLIDGDHSLTGVAADFRLVCGKARYVALHDTACVGLRYIQVKEFWEQVKGDYPHCEFLNQDADFPGCLGIGVLLVGAH